MSLSAFFDQAKITAYCSKKRSQEILLVSGTVVQLIRPGEPAYSTSATDFCQVLQEATKPLILLGAPFVYSFIQETIPLKKNELIYAEAQTIGFSRFAKENRILETYPIAQQTNLTTYSHLSERGLRFIKQLKPLGSAADWQPVIPFVAYRLAHYRPAGLSNGQILNLAFEEELLQVAWKGEVPTFKHFYYWPENSNLTQSVHRIESLHPRKEESPAPATLYLNHSHDPDSRSAEISTAIFNRSVKPKERITRKQVTASKLLHVKKIPLYYALVPLTAALLVWAIWVESNVHSLVTDRLNLERSVTALQDRTRLLEKIAHSERSLLQMESLAHGATSSQLHPTLIIKTLATIIPESSWIQSISISLDTIDLVLMDSQSSTLSAVIKTLQREIGDTQLKESSIIQHDSTVLRKQILSIKRKIQHDKP